MLYGRDPERAQIGRLLDGARSARGGALVVRGEPGIGKTALLEDARDRAADMHVLTVRGVESDLRPALHLVPYLPKLDLTSRTQLARLPLGAEGHTAERVPVPSPA